MKYYLEITLELKEQVLKIDPDAIREIGLIAQKGIKAEDVVNAYEDGNIDVIYKKAKILVEMKNVYDELNKAYYDKIRTKDR